MLEHPRRIGSIRRMAALLVVCTAFAVMPATAASAAAPKVSSFTPTSGVVGTKVTVKGTNFASVKYVKFAGVVSTFKVASTTKLTATVPAGAKTGKITVTTTGGTATSVANFSVLPSVSSFTPSSGIIGSNVTIAGSGLFGATSVTLNGLATTYTVNSANSITMTVPAGATSGTIAVFTPSGNTTTGSNYTVLPHISSFTPAAGQIGGSVVITGSGFDLASAVTLNGVSAVFTLDTPTQITATVPSTTSGPIAVTTPAGVATSTTNFKILPSVIASTAVAPPGSAITLSGYGFDPNTAIDVYFDGTQIGLGVTDLTGTFTGLPITVPASATPGAHKISGAERASTNLGQTAFTVRTDWAQWRNTPSHRASNNTENVVGVGNVGGLSQDWSATLNGAPTGPVIAGGSLFVGSGAGTLYAFDATTGAALWSAPVTAAINAAPAVSGSNVYVTSADGKLWAFDTTTGVASWGSPITLTGTSNSAPTVAGGIVYVGTTTNVYAIDAANGAVDWTQAPALGSFTATSAAVANGTVVFTSSTGRIVAYQANAVGGFLWSTTVGASQLTSPLIVAGAVYAGSTNGNAYSVNLVSGGFRWSNNPAGFAFNSTPSFANGLLYMGSNDGTVYAFDTSGNNPWNNGNGTAYRSPSVVANGVVYAGSDDNDVYAFDAANGNQLWSGATNGTVRSSPVLVNGMLYTPSNDNHVYAYDLTAP